MRIKVPVATNPGGAATVYAGPIIGKLVGVHVVIGTMTATAAFAITEEDTTEALLNIADASAISGVVRPMSPTIDPAGSAIATLFVPPFIVGRIKTVVSGGGVSKAGEIWFDIEGSQSGDSKLGRFAS